MDACEARVRALGGSVGVSVPASAKDVPSSSAAGRSTKSPRSNRTQDGVGEEDGSVKSPVSRANSSPKPGSEAMNSSGGAASVGVAGGGAGGVAGASAGVKVGASAGVGASELEQARGDLEAANQEKVAVKERIKTWTIDFTKANGREPTAAERSADLMSAFKQVLLLLCELSE